MIFSSCVFIFFFYSSAAHRALHSFPTRRSSDLGEPSLGDMTFSEALIQSCDTVYYNLGYDMRSEEHTSELQSHSDLVCRLLLEKKKKTAKYEPLDVRRERASLINVRRQYPPI